VLVPTSVAIPLAVVLNSFDPGGTEHQMTELMCRLDPTRFAVHAVCLGDRGALRSKVAAAGISITEFPIRGLASAATARQGLRLAAWCRQRGIQILHTCDFYSNVFALPAAALSGVPVRIASRRDIFIPERTGAKRRAQRLSYAFAHRVVANSAAAANCVVAEGVPAERIAVIVNGLELERFRGTSDRTVRRTIATVAHLRPGKGHDVLLRAAVLVVQCVPEAHFLIVGDGTRRLELERLAHDLGLAGHVTFAGHQEDVAAVLRHCDIFAFPSYMEASPNAVLEAMASRLPVVASNVGGIPEVIQDGVSGLLTPAGDSDALAAALLRVLQDAELADRLATAARQVVEARFSFDRMTLEFEGLYLAELATRAPAALAWAAAQRSHAVDPRRVSGDHACGDLGTLRRGSRHE